MSQLPTFLSNPNITNNSNTSNNNLRQTARFFIHNKFNQQSNNANQNTNIISPKSSNHNFNINITKTSSKIILPAGKYHFNKDRKIRWVRIYNKIIQKLYFMDDLLYFQCSPLDYQCKIQATIEHINQSNVAVQDKMQYGPIQLDTQSGVKTQEYLKTPIQCLTIFDGQTNHKVRQINIIFDSGIIIQGISPYALDNDQISSIHITTVKDNMIIISGLNQRLLSQKVYNDGMWYQNSFQATKIKFQNNQAFLSALYNINRLKFNISSLVHRSPRLSQKQFSPRLTFTRQSNLSSTQGVNTISPTNSYLNEKFSKQIKKSTISQNSPYVHNKKHQQQKSMKKSQIISKIPKNSMAPSQCDGHPTSVQDDKQNYQDQFDVLFQDDTQTQELCLNDSFEQFQKKSALDGSQQAKYKMIEEKKVQQKKKQKQKIDLQQKVNELIRQNEKLLSINQRLKDQLLILKDKSQPKQIKSLTQVQAMVYSLKKYENKLELDIQNINNKNSQSLARSSSVQQFKQNQDMTLSFSAKKGKQLQNLNKQYQNQTNRKQFQSLSFDKKGIIYQKSNINVNNDDELFQCSKQ